MYLICKAYQIPQMSVVYVAAFIELGNDGLTTHTVGVSRSLVRAFRSLHNFAVSRYPQFFDVTNFPINEMNIFIEEMNENGDQTQLFREFVNRFVIPFTVTGSYRARWDLSVTRTTMI